MSKPAEHPIYQPECSSFGLGTEPSTSMLVLATPAPVEVGRFWLTPRRRSGSLRLGHENHVKQTAVGGREIISATDGSSTNHRRICHSWGVISIVHT